MGRLSLSSTPLLLLDLEELKYIWDVNVLVRCVWICLWHLKLLGEVGQAFVHAALSQCHFFRKSDKKTTFVTHCQLTCWCKCAMCLGLVPKLPLAVPWVQPFIPPRLLPTGKVIQEDRSMYFFFPQATPTCISLNCWSLLSELVCISYCVCWLQTTLLWQTADE